MKPTGRTLRVNWQQSDITIEEFESGKALVYKANLTNQPVLFLTKTKDSNKVSFWTSVPEGRLETAEQIGNLIDAITNKPKNQTNNKSTQTELF